MVECRALDAGQVSYRTGGMQERRDAGKMGCRKGGNLCHERFRKEEIGDWKDSGLDGYRK